MGLKVCWWGAGRSEGCQQAISSKAPRAVCMGTFTVWLMVSEWFGIVSQVLWRGGEGAYVYSAQLITMLLAAQGTVLPTWVFSCGTVPPAPDIPCTGLPSGGVRLRRPLCLQHSHHCPPRCPAGWAQGSLVMRFSSLLDLLPRGSPEVPPEATSEWCLALGLDVPHFGGPLLGST